MILKRGKRIKNFTKITVLIAMSVMIGIGPLQFAPIVSAEVGQQITEVPVQGAIPSGMNRVIENRNLELYLDNTNGNFAVKQKASGKVWLSNPENPEKDKKAKDRWKTNLASQLFIEYTNQEGRISDSTNSFVGSVRKKGIITKSIPNGFRIDYNFIKEKMTIPLEITIDDESMTAKIPIKDILVTGEDHILSGITVLPFFGAQGMDAQGYMMVPDGSGALINLNNGKAGVGNFSARVYGEDASISVLNKFSVTEAISLPVFGMKNSNNAFLGVIEKGDGVATINASVSGALTSFNTVYTNFSLRSIDHFYIQDISGKLRENPVVDNGKIMHDELKIKYFFLTDKESDYTGMAKKYQQYLIKGKVTTSNKVNKGELYIDLYAGTIKKKPVLGIPVKSLQVLTTYNQASQMVDELRNVEVDDVVIRYKNATKEAINKSIPSKAKPLNQLGGRKEFNKLSEKLGEGKLYLEAGFTDVSAYGWFLSTINNTVKNVMGLPAYQYHYDLANSFKAENQPKWYLLNPKVAANKMMSYISSPVKEKSDSYVALTGIGEKLYSDFGSKRLNREETKIQWLKVLDKARESNRSLMLTGANAYAVPYAQRLMDVTTSASGYLLEDEEIPFLQLVLNGVCDYAIKPINLSSNPNEAFLRAIESGSSLHYAFIDNDASLLAETELQWLYSPDFKSWKSDLKDKYKKYKEVFNATNGMQIESHKVIKEGIVQTTYKNGVRIIVNYTEQSFLESSVIVNPNDFAIIR